MFLDLQAVNSNGEEGGKVKCYGKKTENCSKQQLYVDSIETKKLRKLSFSTYMHLNLPISTTIKVAI